MGMSSSVKFLSMYFAHFLVGLFGSFTVRFWESLYIYSRYKFLVRYEICKYFLLAYCLSFILLTESSRGQKFLILMKSSLSILFFIINAFLCVPRNLCLPIELSQCLFQNQLTLYLCISVLLICMLILTPMQHCLDYYDFRVSWN